MEKPLTLEEAKIILIKKALKKYKTFKEAAEALGCTTRYLNYKIKEINKNEDGIQS